MHFWKGYIFGMQIRLLQLCAKYQWRISPGSWCFEVKVLFINAVVGKTALPICIAFSIEIIQLYADTCQKFMSLLFYGVEMQVLRQDYVGLQHSRS